MGVLFKRLGWRHIPEEEQMKRNSTTILALMSAVLLSVVSAQTDWVKYSSPEGRYSILFPSQPRLSASPGVVVQNIASSSDTNGVHYIADYSDNAPGTTFSFVQGRDGLVRNMRGTLISDVAITLGGVKGRSFKFSTPGPDGKGYLVQARYYQTGTRVYLLQLIAAKAVSPTIVAAAGGKYFGSFQIVKAQ
jgi:hypothetical protein